MNREQRKQAKRNKAAKRRAEYERKRNADRNQPGAINRQPRDLGANERAAMRRANRAFRNAHKGGGR